MDDLSDFDLHDASSPSARSLRPAPHRSREALGLVVLILVAIGIGAYILTRQQAGPVPIANVQAPADAAPPSQARPLGGAGDAIDLPPLDRTDPTVRMLVKMLTSHPTVAAWLATDGLIRNFTAGVANVADGRTPAKQTAAIRPNAPFRVSEHAGALSIDPASYQRYDAVVNALASADAAGWARLYATLKPRIEEAYADLGRGSGSFDRALQQAIVQLLRTPVVDPAVRPAAKGIGYEFTDPRLEHLTAAQKQLLRMGPRNVRLLQRELRDVALALGIPPGDLPTP